MLPFCPHSAPAPLTCPSSRQLRQFSHSVPSIVVPTRTMYLGLPLFAPCTYVYSPFPLSRSIYHHHPPQHLSPRRVPNRRFTRKRFFLPSPMKPHTRPRVCLRLLGWRRWARRVLVLASTTSTASYWTPLGPVTATMTMTVKARRSSLRRFSALLFQSFPLCGKTVCKPLRLAGQGGSSIAVTALNSSRRSSPACLLPP